MGLKIISIGMYVVIIAALVLMAIFSIVVITICIVIIIVRFAYDAQRIRDHYVSPLEELHRFGAFVEACENEFTFSMILFFRLSKMSVSIYLPIMPQSFVGIL